MKLLCSVLILASVLVAQAKPGAVQTQLQSALDQYLAHAQDFDTTITADVTTQCFSLYLPMLNEVAATFSSSYKSCVNTASAEAANLTAQAAKQQTIYQQEVTSLCSAFTTCDSDNDTSTFFTCYANAANSDVSLIYDIATNSASSASSLSESMKAIQATEYQCTNTTESNYVRDTAATYDLLDSCLKYGVPTVSTAAPSPSTNGPVASSSGAPTSTVSTLAPTTDVSSSSAVPVTTAAPGTSGNVTTAAAGTPAAA
ncbi:putative GPI-anchored protein pfl2 [Drosophila miranda]|uniref:putative GPI-anchored protein pfl2 n=1 Tax=Drosophila miranda TaxID=7229 RepID=UPI0007E761ED|nr:putative GPI-anchored protein pfl2 [Drosophila miranda]